jgi:hypothetical protein
LRRLAAKGLSSGEIARKMNMTRCKIMGKVYREEIVLGAGETHSERCSRGYYASRARQA